MTTPVKLLRQVRRRVQAVTYGSPIYRLMLDQGPVPERIALKLADSWPGNAQAGQALIATQPGLFENDGAPANPRKNKQLLAHQWLRDLRAVGTDPARRKAQNLLAAWLEHQDEWQADGWAPDVLGERLANWIGFYDFYSPHAPPDFNARLMASLMRQVRHLLRTLPATLGGLENLRALKGLIYAGLALRAATQPLADGDRALSLALDRLRRQLADEILPDGGHIARNPSQHMQFLRGLIDLRNALRAAKLDVPHPLMTAIDRMVPALKLFRHGDGALALFNGGHEESALDLEAVLSLAEAKGRVLRRLPQTGYERLTAGRSLLLVDVGEPPPPPHDHAAHAGLLSFEFSVGRERLIVNCGAGPADDEDWRLATAATAAHSALTLADTNACEVLADGGIGHRPRSVTSQRYERDGNPTIEAQHDGYARNFHVTHHRTLSLTAEGEALQGREILSGPPGRDFTLRWHLHPGVQAALLQGGQAALLRTPSGQGWRLKLEPADTTAEPHGTDFGLESSIYCGGPTPRRTLQLKVSARTQTDPTILTWTLTREKKA